MFGALLEVTVASSAGGSLWLSALGGLLFIQGDGSNDERMVFQGEPSRVASALSGLQYRGAPGFSGSDVIFLSVDDMGNTGSPGPQNASASVDVQVQAFNDAPVLHLPIGPLRGEEGATITVSSVTVSDEDAGAGGTVALALAVSHGTLQVTRGGNRLLMSAGVDGAPARTLAFTATLADANAALATLQYTPQSYWSGRDVLELEVNDLGNSGAGGSRVTAAQLTLIVTAVNDAPRVMAPESISVIEDTPYALSGISVFDAEAADSPSSALEVGIALVGCGEGAGASLFMPADVPGDAAGSALAAPVMLAAAVDAGPSASAAIRFLEGDGRGNARMRFRGSQLDVNSALAHAVFSPGPNWSGTCNIVVSANDLGGAGAGGSKSDSRSVAVSVSPVNDAPVIALSSGGVMALTAEEDADLPLTGVVLADVDLVSAPQT